MDTNQAAIVILTFNCQEIIKETIEAAKKVTNNIVIVDSFSTDSTIKIAKLLGCRIHERAFKNYSDQRNWIINELNGAYAWQLHLDADEVLDQAAIEEIATIISNDPSGSHPQTYMLRRIDYFLGKQLRHSGVNPWHLRLFTSGHGACEDRLYDQHFVGRVPAKKLAGCMHDKNSLTLTDWIARHNRWSDLEAKEAVSSSVDGKDILHGKLTGDARERTRYIKSIYYKLPVGIRPIAYFFYRYIFKLGFLDGVNGFLFAFFQALWFRMLVDAKIYERRNGSM